MAKTYIYLGIGLIVVGTIVWIYGDKMAGAI